MEAHKFTTTAHARRRFCGPIFAEKADRALAALNLGSDDVVLDLGCGKGEFLIRAAERYGCRGIGLDFNQSFLNEAEQASIERGVASLIEWRKSDGKRLKLDRFGATAALCTGATHILGGIGPTCRRLGELLPEGGRMLVADGFWRRPPDPRYLEFLGGREEELANFEGTRAALVDAGLLPTLCMQSSQDEWDDYEGDYIGACVDFARENPDDPDAPDIINRIRAWNDAYIAYGRDALGLIWMVGWKLSSAPSDSPS